MFGTGIQEGGQSDVGTCSCENFPLGPEYVGPKSSGHESVVPRVSKSGGL